MFFLYTEFAKTPWKTFFGQQQQRGRASGNPSSSEFIHNTQALRVISNACGTIRGNCRGGATIESDMLESAPLPKWPRTS